MNRTVKTRALSYHHTSSTAGGPGPQLGDLWGMKIALLEFAALVATAFPSSHCVPGLHVTARAKLQNQKRFDFQVYV